ncbi:MAG: plastocyanin/azurin family copper-binding protein [Gammaproteobacteria bacterium]
MYKKTILAIIIMFSLTGGMKAFAEDYVINAQARVFAPAILYIQSGDTVQWVNMTSHNTVSIENMIPEGAEGWRGDLGENLSITLTEEGVYPYVCEPHIGFGMVGAIIVGEPVNIDASMEYARENLEGPYRRILGKLIKIQRAAKKE